MRVFSRNKLEVPDALISLGDTVVGIFLTYGREPENRDNFIRSLNAFSAHCIKEYDEFMAIEETESKAEVMQ